MKRVLLVSLLFALALSVTTDLKVDWREFISRSDPLWKFDAKDENTMPVKWFDAPFHGSDAHPHGNGSYVAGSTYPPCIQNSGRDDRNSGNRKKARR